MNQQHQVVRSPTPPRCCVTSISYCACNRIHANAAAISQRQPRLQTGSRHTHSHRYRKRPTYLLRTRSSMLFCNQQRPALLLGRFQTLVGNAPLCHHWPDRELHLAMFPRCKGYFKTPKPHSDSTRPLQAHPLDRLPQDCPAYQPRWSTVTIAILLASMRRIGDIPLCLRAWQTQTWMSENLSPWSLLGYRSMISSKSTHGPWLRSQ
jgi:hypothetical protein